MSNHEARSYDYLLAETPAHTMTRQREIELSALALAGDKAASGELAEGNMRYAMVIARRYSAAHPNIGLSALCSACFYGMLVAAKSFDGTRGVRFISYASHQMHQACRLELAMMSSPVRLPPSVSQGVRAVRQFYDRPENAGRRPHTGDTDAILETGPEVLTKNKGRRSFVESAIVSQTAHRSLEAPLSSGDEAPGATHKDRLADSHASADNQADQNSTASLVAEMVGTLPPREQYIVRRYFLAEPDGEAASLNEISDELGVTRERVRQLKNRAVEAMRKRWGGEISLMLAN